MVASAGAASSAHQQPGLGLRLGARQLGFAQRLGGVGEHLAVSASACAASALGGGAIDAEQPGVGVGLGPGIDAVGEAALLAQFLEQPRGHAAAGRPG